MMLVVLRRSSYHGLGPLDHDLFDVRLDLRGQQLSQLRI